MIYEVFDEHQTMILDDYGLSLAFTESLRIAIG